MLAKYVALDSLFLRWILRQLRTMKPKANWSVLLMHEAPTPNTYGTKVESPQTYDNMRARKREEEE